MRVTEFETLATQLIHEIEQAADAARGDVISTQELEATVIDAAVDLARAIARPLVDEINKNTSTHTGTSLFPATAFYIAAEVVGQILDDITSHVDDEFPRMTRMMAKYIAETKIQRKTIIIDEKRRKKDEEH